jgi:hypothetical protein
MFTALASQQADGGKPMKSDEKQSEQIQYSRC